MDYSQDRTDEDLQTIYPTEILSGMKEKANYLSHLGNNYYISIVPNSII